MPVADARQVVDLNRHWGSGVEAYGLCNLLASVDPRPTTPPRLYAVSWWVGSNLLNSDYHKPTVTVSQSGRGLCDLSTAPLTGRLPRRRGTVTASPIAATTQEEEWLILEYLRLAVGPNESAQLLSRPRNRTQDCRHILPYGRRPR
jgi:hypothetical protein